MLSWPAKDPDEVLDYTVDWGAETTPVLAEGETIETFEFLVIEGEVTIDSYGQSGSVCTVWLSGGVIGEVNIITNRITTSEGRTYDQSMKLRIRSK